VSVIVGIDKLEKRFAALKSPQAQQAFLNGVGLRTVAALKQRVPRKTGTTGRSIRVGSLTTRNAQVIGSQVIQWIDQGTGLYGPRHHPIFPTHKKALSWHAGTTGPQGNLRLSGRPRKGRAATRVTVRSTAGMRPRPFVETSVRDAAARSGLADVVVKLWNDAA